MTTPLLHSANERGHVQNEWLDSYHSFSFGSYYNPERMGHGLLRVLNDDTVRPSQGFGEHPHDNMEIVSIPLSGQLRHHDSEGNSTIIGPHEVQLMSAGRGVRHSEYNHSSTEEVNFLQIWVQPLEHNILPRYEQAEFRWREEKDQLHLVVSPQGVEAEGIKINQKAYFSLGAFHKDQKLDYRPYHSEHFVYLFVIQGEVQSHDHSLQKRDALAFSPDDLISLQMNSDTQILIIEVPGLKG